MQLKDEWNEEEIIAELLPTLPAENDCKLRPPDIKNNGGVITHPNGKHYFITSPYIRSYTYFSFADFPTFVQLSSPILHTL